MSNQFIIILYLHIADKIILHILLHVQYGMIDNNSVEPI